MADRPERWCILTMSPGRTIPVARALIDAGFTVWTPTEVRQRLAGRQRKAIEQDCAITPSFVFADYAQRIDLAALSRSPSQTYRKWDSALRRMVEHGVPHFSMFRARSGLPWISDASLEPLRAIEARLLILSDRRREQARQKGAVPRFSAGEIVRVSDGAFGGLDLVVTQANRGKMVSVDYTGWTRSIEISAWTLRAVQVMDGAQAA